MSVDSINIYLLTQRMLNMILNQLTSGKGHEMGTLKKNKTLGETNCRTSKQYSTISRKLPYFILTMFFKAKSLFIRNSLVFNQENRVLKHKYASYAHSPGHLCSREM